MTSNINPSTINTAYPVSGVDQSSQGFRTNFTNIAGNFTTAASEITDLQNKAVLISPLNGQTNVSNNLSNTIIANAQTQGFRTSVYEFGSISGTMVVDVSQGDYQRATITGATSITFVNWPAAETYQSVILELYFAGSTVAVTFPTTATVDTNHVVDFNPSTGVYQFRNAYSELIKIGTSNAGTTLSLENIGAPKGVQTRTPTAIGAATDVKGTILYDSTNLYVCTGTYDGSNVIWKYVTLTAV